MLISHFNEPDCCNDTSSRRYCFYYESVKYKSIKIRKVDITNILVKNSDFREHACLPARRSMSLKQSCKQSRHCTNEYYQDMLCLKPLSTNRTKVIRITHEKGREILFVGAPYELTSSIIVSDYIPKYSISLINFPEFLKTLSLYLLSISSALAVLNMVPCFYLDGHQTMCTLLEMCFPQKPLFRSLVGPVILFCGTSLLFVNIFIALCTLFYPR